MAIVLRIDIAINERADIGNSGAAQRCGAKIWPPTIRVGNADKFGASNLENTSMITAHDADADNAHTQWTLRACCYSLHHVSKISPLTDQFTRFRAWPFAVATTLRISR